MGGRERRWANGQRLIDCGFPQEKETRSVKKKKMRERKPTEVETGKSGFLRRLDLWSKGEYIF
jgi:hypothetical protein